MCQVLGVSKSGYYEWLKRPVSNQKKAKAKLVAKIRRIHLQSRGIYGSPKITKVLDSEGIKVSQKTVSKIMKENNIKSKTVKKYKATTNSNHQLPVSPNLLNQNFRVDAPGKVWVADITDIWTSQGWLYLATVMDLYSRRILGWAMDKRMTKELVISALQRAIDRQPPKEGLIHHSDRGTQYCSKAYRTLLHKHGIISSMSRKGNCYDNACIESFHSIIKKEWIFHEKYRTRDQAKESILEYMLHFYNCRRIHGTIGYKTPIAYEKEYYKQKKAS